MNYANYNERATSMVQLSILAALAKFHLSTLDDQNKDKGTSSLLNPFYVKLKELWLCALKDYAVLSTQSRATQKAYNGVFFNYATGSFVSDYFNSSQAWSVILLACCSLYCESMENLFKQQQEDQQQNIQNETNNFFLL